MTTHPQGDFARLLKTEVERLEAEAARIAEYLAALRPLCERYNGKPAPAKERAPRVVVPKARGAAAPKYDWANGLVLWKAQKPVPEIAKALGTTAAAVYYQSKKWPKRPEQPRTGRPPKPVEPASKPQQRQSLRHSVTCPNCEKVTIVDPCKHCNMVLPTSVVATVGTW